MIPKLCDVPEHYLMTQMPKPDECWLCMKAERDQLQSRCAELEAKLLNPNKEDKE